MKVLQKYVELQDEAKIVGWTRFLFWSSAIFFIPKKEVYERVNKIDCWDCDFVKKE